MAKVREIYVETKRSRNFQTYTVGQFVVLEENEDPNQVIAKYRANCRSHVNKEIELDMLSHSK